VNEIVRIAISNNQVRICEEGQNFLKSFTEKYKPEIDPALGRVFDKMKNSFHCPVLKKS
jgi:hypothetical protein